jgi:cytochrome c oxidase assembly protein subunit 15
MTWRGFLQNASRTRCEEAGQDHRSKSLAMTKLLEPSDTISSPTRFDRAALPSVQVVPPARWLHRGSILLVGLVWPLIWVGGLVTTYSAGMAVPDWPGTYGYNLFLYPYQTWLFGPFDLFIEHGHRLLGAFVGMVAIGTVLFAVLTEPRVWVRWLAAAILVAVIAQGALGGARVILADRGLAMLHGCTAEVFFAMCVGLMVVTSRWWWAQADRAAGAAADGVPGRGLVAVAVLLVLLSYLQVVLGAMLRHVQPTAAPTGFSHLVTTHVVTALIVLGLAAGMAYRIFRRRSRGGCGDLALLRPAGLLVTLVATQIALGLATWVSRYGIPAFAQVSPWTASYLVKNQAFFESLVITGHVATGALVLVTSTFLLLRLGRVRRTLLGLRQVAEPIQIPSG